MAAASNAPAAQTTEDIIAETTDRKDSSGWRRPEAQRNFYPNVNVNTSDFDEVDKILNEPSEFLEAPRYYTVFFLW